MKLLRNALDPVPADATSTRCPITLADWTRCTASKLVWHLVCAAHWRILPLNMQARLYRLSKARDPHLAIYGAGCLAHIELLISNPEAPRPPRFQRLRTIP